MFEREAHRAVSAVLAALDPAALRSFGAWFGGGTRIAMDLGEYRESRDADFLCADASLWADLRVAILERGYDALLKPEGRRAVGLPREIRSDQYGVRFPVVVGQQSVRVEIIHEARIPLSDPVQLRWAPVDCLSITDCFAEKLLANCDRWADRDALARDLLDLAALVEAHGPVPANAWALAEGAYKAAVREALHRAALAFLEDEKHRVRCFDGLGISEQRGERLRGMIRGFSR